MKGFSEFQIGINYKSHNYPTRNVEKCFPNTMKFYSYLFFQEKMDSMFRKGESPDSWIPVDVSFIKAKSLTSAIFRNKGI